jgi:hypothetical protein
MISKKSKREPRIYNRSFSIITITISIFGLLFAYLAYYVSSKTYNISVEPIINCSFDVTQPKDTECGHVSIRIYNQGTIPVYQLCIQRGRRAWVDKTYRIRKFIPDSYIWKYQEQLLPSDSLSFPLSNSELSLPKDYLKELIDMDPGTWISPFIVSFIRLPDKKPYKLHFFLYMFLDLHTGCYSFESSDEWPSFFHSKLDSIANSLYSN